MRTGKERSEVCTGKERSGKERSEVRTGKERSVVRTGKERSEVRTGKERSEVCTGKERSGRAGGAKKILGHHQQKRFFRASTGAGGNSRPSAGAVSWAAGADAASRHGCARCRDIRPLHGRGQLRG